jgi:hypothetical protein
VQPISLGTWRQSIIFRDMAVSFPLSRADPGCVPEFRIS